MKLLSGLVFGLVSAAENGKPNRNVPPRHPSNRLNRLANKLAVDILDHPNLEWKQARKDRVLTNLQDFAEKMQDRFDSDHCGFYSSELKHGGPDPEPGTRDTGKPRNPTNRRRREAEDWRSNWWVAADTQYTWLYEYCFTRDVAALDDDEGNADEEKWDFVLETGDDLCTEDKGDACEWFDLQTCQFKNIDGGVLERGGKKGGRKLSDNPQKAWKQVTTGLKKWAQRYLNNCHGMRKNKLPANRAKSMYNRWVNKFPITWT